MRYFSLLNSPFNEFLNVSFGNLRVQRKSKSSSSWPLTPLILFSLATLPFHPEGAFIGKWWLIYAVMVLVLVDLWRTDSLKIPEIRLKPLLKVKLISLVAVVLLTNFTSLLDFHRFIFVVLGMWAFQGPSRFPNHLRTFVAASLLPVFWSMIGDLVALNWTLPTTLPPETFSGGFGNANLAGEYLVFVYALILYGVDETAFSRRVYGILSICCLGAIALTRCRSAELASALITLLFFWRAKGIRFWIGPAFAVLAIGLSFQLSRSSANKMNTFFQRTEIWRQTLRLIRDHPLGVGRHRFPFEFATYREGDSYGDDKIMPNPHNEFLMTIAEDGVPYALLVSIALVLIFLPIASNLGRPEYSVLIALVVQMLLQFPLDDPFPFIVTALCLGVWLRKYGTPATTLSFRSAPIKGVLVLAIFTLGFKTIYPQWVAAQSVPQVPDLKFACHLNPLDSRACWTLGATQARLGQNDGCIADMTEQLGSYPNFPIYRKVRAVCEFQKGLAAEGCADLFAYLKVVRSSAIQQLYDARNCQHP